MHKIFLGVDGGGTKCRMRLTDSGMNVLADWVGGPANLQIERGAVADATLREGIAAVFAKAGLPDANRANCTACFGLAGAHLPEARADFARRDFALARFTVTTDVETAWAGAHGLNDGGVLILGTGSAAYGRVGDAVVAAGGWGFHVGDNGSGARLGQRACRMALEAADGLRPQTALSRAIMAKFDGQAGMMGWSFAAKPHDFGAFAELVLAHADDGLGANLIGQQLADIALYFDWFAQKGIARVAVVGGLGAALLPRLAAAHPGRAVPPDADALTGALLLARRAANNKDKSQ